MCYERRGGFNGLFDFKLPLLFGLLSDPPRTDLWPELFENANGAYLSNNFSHAINRSSNNLHSPFFSSKRLLTRNLPIISVNSLIVIIFEEKDKEINQNKRT